MKVPKLDFNKLNTKQSEQLENVLDQAVMHSKSLALETGSEQSIQEAPFDATNSHISYHESDFDPEVAYINNTD